MQHADIRGLTADDFDVEGERFVIGAFEANRPDAETRKIAPAIGSSAAMKRACPKRFRSGTACRSLEGTMGATQRSGKLRFTEPENLP